jgi:2-polyprenyl-3-methyl-5-hydroxy-6-metoxy-1,4-benzoquinol methylase
MGGDIQKSNENNDLAVVALSNVEQTDVARLTGLDFTKIVTYCRAMAMRKYSNPMSPYMVARLNAGYFSPEDHYEALIDRIVTEKVSWLDVGCGRSPFPNNSNLATELSIRCRRIVGVDPDPSINDNGFVHEQHQLAFEDYFPNSVFDVVTARMVVEHVEDPQKFGAALSRVTSPGSLVVMFTVNWWSLTTLAARFSPIWMHRKLKSALWNSMPRDSFKTEYRMNQREKLRSLMSQAGFMECLFRVLPDASLFWRVPYIRRLELLTYKLALRLRIPYFDTCILAVYRRS